jgi:hypothetical protein
MKIILTLINNNSKREVKYSLENKRIEYKVNKSNKLEIMRNYKKK